MVNSISCRVAIAWAFLAAMFVGCDVERDAAEAESSIQETPEWREEFDEMVIVLELDEGEADYLLWAFEERDAAIEGFMASPDGQQLAEEEEMLWDAVRGRSLSRVRSLTAKASGKRQKLMDIIEDADAQIREAIPVGKRIPWDAHRISSALFEVAEPLDLNWDQQFRIEEHAVVCIEAARASNKPAPIPAAYVALETWSESAVMTPQQRIAFDELKKKSPFRSFVD